MRRDELRRAVERPAQRAGLHVEPELSEALVADVEHEPGALPMLSTALLELWQRRDGRRLRLATYEATGGVRGAVARHAEDAFGRLDRGQQAVARSVLLRLAAEDAGGVIERRRIALTELDEDVAQVVAALTDQRLLTVSAGSVELAHEALMREWPRLRRWLEEDAEGRRLHRRLADAARDWGQSGHDTGDLYRGARLTAALEWRTRHEPDLNRTERAFLDAGRSAEQRELHAARARRRRAVTFGIGVLVVITGISTILAVHGIQRASYEQRAAVSRNLATRALARLQDNVALAGLIGVEAYRLEPTIEARSAVLSVLRSLAGYRRIGGPLEHGTGLEAVAISPDGRTLASATDDGSIWLWDIATRRRLGRPLRSRAGVAMDVAFSPDGTRLASGGDDARVRLWDVATRRPIGHPLQHRDAVTVNGVAFSPDGKTLASGGGGPERSTQAGQHGTVQLWDVATGRALGPPLETTSTTIGDVQFSPNGTLLAVAGTDSNVQLWDPATRRLLAPPLAGHNGDVFAVAFSPNGGTLAGGGDDDTVRLWDVRTHRPLGGALGSHAEVVNTVAFSPDGRTLASGGNDATVRLWSVATHRPRGVLVSDTDRPADRQGTGRVAGVLGVAFSPRGGILASADERGAVQLWDVRPRRPLSRPLPGHDGWVRSVAFTSDGSLASGGTDETVRLWNPRNYRPLGGPLPSTGSVLAVAPSPDGRTLAVAGADGALRLWDARGHRPLGRPLKGHAGYVNAAAFSPDGDTLASGGEDGTVRLWDANSRQPIGPPLDARAGAVNGVAFGKDGDVLASAGQDGRVRLWDVGDHHPVGPPLRGATGFVNAVAFTPDGEILASAGQDKSVWLWDVDARRPLAPPLTGHTDVIGALAFSPNGRTLASAGADHTVRLWDVRTRHALGRPLDHDSWVSALAFSPDGKGLASAGDHGTVRVWDPILWSDDLDTLQNRLCASIRRSLTRAEWAEYLPDRPYDQTCPGTH
jgi:WD40 repeat protein